MMNRHKLVALCTELLTQPYTQNTLYDKSHEKMVVDTISRNGFVQVPKDTLNFSKKDFNEALKTGISLMPPNTFAYQVFGENNFPDIILDDTGLMVPVECKSSRQDRGGIGAPHFNNTLPSGFSLYVMSFSSENATVLAWGCHILDLEEFQSLMEYKKNLAAVPKPALKHISLNHRVGIDFKKTSDIFKKSYREMWAQEILREYSGNSLVDAPRRPVSANHGLWGSDDSIN